MLRLPGDVNQQPERRRTNIRTTPHTRHEHRKVGLGEPGTGAIPGSLFAQGSASKRTEDTDVSSHSITDQAHPQDLLSHKDSITKVKNENLCVKAELATIILTKISKCLLQMNKSVFTVFVHLKK